MDWMLASAPKTVPVSWNLEKVLWEVVGGDEVTKVELS